MSTIAYAVLVIHCKSREVKGVAVLCEPDPGFSGMFCTALFSEEAEDWETAHKRVLSYIDGRPEYAWLRPVTEWKRGVIGRPGETVEIEKRLEVLEEKMERVLGHLVLD